MTLATVRPEHFRVGPGICRRIALTVVALLFGYLLSVASAETTAPEWKMTPANDDGKNSLPGGKNLGYRYCLIGCYHPSVVSELLATPSCQQMIIQCASPLAFLIPIDTMTGPLLPDSRLVYDPALCRLFCPGALFVCTARHYYRIDT